MLVVVVALTVSGAAGVGWVRDSLPPNCWSTAPAPHSEIRHVFFLIKENHAFENYFGARPGVVGFPPNGSFRVAYGASQSISPFPIAGSSTGDLPHDRLASLADLDGGRNDNFVAQANADHYPHPEDAVGYYTGQQIGPYYTYADSFALGDRFFSGVLGPTLPNRLFDLAATSGNWTTDTFPAPPGFSFPTLLDQLSGAGVSWAYDYAGPRTNLTPLAFPTLSGSPCSAARIVPVSTLGEQLSSPSAPDVVYIDPSHEPAISEHPSANVTVGADWSATVINTIFSSPVGPSSAVFLLFDESGGFWDPVVPPAHDPLGDGFRVPFLVLSPWTPHLLSHETLDPAALLKFVDENWGLAPLNGRVAEAPGLNGFFDFSIAPRSIPILASPVPLNYSAPGPTGPD